MKKILFLIVLCAFSTGFAHAQEYGRGLIMDDAAYEAVPLKATQTRGTYDKLPTAASVKKYCPTPQSQGRYGTCTGWATGYAARTILWAKQNNITNTTQITDQAFSPYFVYRNICSDPLCNNGSLIPNALEVLKNKGNILHKDFNSTCPPFVPSQLWDIAAQFKIQDYNRLYQLGDDYNLKLNAMRKSLAEGNPVVIGMQVGDDFSTIRGDVWDGNQYGRVGGHAMCVVGYDDNKYGGAFEIMNSWGTSWANKGFVWIKYSDFDKYVFYAFETINNIVPPTPPPPPPPPSPAPVVVVPPPTPPKPKPVINNNSDFDFAGDLRFILADNSKMNASIAEMRGLFVNEDNEENYNDNNTPKPKPNANTFNYDPNLTTGKFIAYRMDRAYTEGTKFRVYLRNAEPAYVYAIAMDNTNTAVVLFPHKNNISPLLNYKDNEVALPSEDHYITMDNVRGTDVFCLLYSKEPLDINQICRKLESQTGTFFQRLYKTMKNQLVPREYLRYYNQRMRFEIKSNGTGTVVPIVVEIPHN